MTKKESTFKTDKDWKAEDFIQQDRLFYLPNEMLKKVDRMTMAYSVEGRAPFVAPGILNLADQMAYSDCIKGNTLKWTLRKESKHAALFVFYKALIAMRKSNLYLKMCDREATHVHLHKDQNSIVLERGLTGSSDLLICVLNFSKNQENLPVPKGVNLNQMLLNSSLEIQEYSATIGPISTIHVQPESFIAYSATYV